MTMRGYLFGEEVTLISAVTAATGSAGTPSGDTLAVPPQPIGGRPPNVIFQVVVGGTGSLSALSVDFLYSLDGTNWVIAQTVTDTAGGVYPQTGISAPFWAADVSTLTAASGTPTVTVKWAA